MDDLVEGTGHVERGVSADNKHRIIVPTWIAVIFGAVQLALVIGLIATLSVLGNLSDGSHKSECRDHAFAAFASAIGDAFDAPPAPNTSRSTAVEKIHAAAVQFQAVDEACG